MERVEIKYSGLDGKEHSAYIMPLARKEGVLVLHTLALPIGAMQSGNLLDALKMMDGETFWGIACRLLRMSTIDLIECKDLNTCDLFNGKYSDLYALVFAALKANYPDFFAPLMEILGGIGLKKSTNPATEAEK